jgi:hypothetical protein
MREIAPELRALAIESTFSSRPLNAVKYTHHIINPLHIPKNITMHDIAIQDSFDHFSE